MYHTGVNGISIYKQMIGTCESERKGNGGCVFEIKIIRRIVVVVVVTMMMIMIKMEMEMKRERRRWSV